MPIHERLYSRLAEPPRQRGGWPALSIGSYCGRYATKGWFTRLVLILSFAPVLVMSVLLYTLVQNEDELRNLLGDVTAGAVGFERLSEVSPEVLRNAGAFMVWVMFMIQTGFALLLTPLIGSAAIADDLRSHAFEVYLARPITSIDYLLGKILVVFRPLLLVMVLPVFLILLVGQVMIPGAFAETWHLYFVGFAAAALIALVNSAVILGISSMSKSARYASIIWFILNIGTAIIQANLIALTGIADFDLVSYGANQPAVTLRLVGFDPPGAHRHAARRSTPLGVAFAPDPARACGRLQPARLATRATGGPSMSDLMNADRRSTSLEPEVSPETTIVEARSLARWYGPVVGLTNLDVEIPRGITGLLGANGAGKSTLLRLMTGQLFPSDGTVRVLGHDPATDGDLYRRVGFCSEDDALFGRHDADRDGPLHGALCRVHEGGGA